MICQIVKNGGYIILILCFWMFTVSSSVRENKFTIQEFCSRNLYMHNIEPGEIYKFTLKSKTSLKDFERNKWYQLTKRICRQDFKTSNTAAHFVVAITDMDIPSCDHCRCNYFEISVSGHSKRFCGKEANDYFASKSDEISIEFYHGRNMKFDVSFTIQVERNFYIITGMPRENFGSSSYIETPYFPTPYPASYRADYFFQSDDPSGHVLLLFVDFQISHHSFIEISGHNNTHLSRFHGNIFRPPVIVSESNQLTLKFQSADDETIFAGFRAILSFIKNPDALVVPYTNCGGLKDDIGGFANIEIQKTFRLYDCVWQIMPYFPLPKSNLSVFAHLRNIGFKSNFEFRCGRNSKAKIVKEINCEVEKNCQSLDVEIIIPASEDLYMRFNGYLDESSVLNFSYSTYHTGNCSNKEFRCKNGRCIKSSFQCDRISHCPDESDEELCPVTELPEIEEHKTVQTESYHSNEVNKSLMSFVIVSCFALIAIITIAVYRYYKSVRSEPVIPQHRSDELSDVQSTLHPVYLCDDLPSYEDFIKSSDNYPPLLYIRESTKQICSQCTTSFCSGARIRHQSADSVPLHNYDTENRDIFLNIFDVPHATHSQNSNRYDIEIIQNNLKFKAAKGSVRRAHSLDSKLNNLVNQDSCHVLLSIVRPQCSHLNHFSHNQWHTLPSNFKISASCNENKLPSQKIDSNVNSSRNRRLTWSFVPHNFSGSEFQTIVKTRCSSEPCSSISIHCQLY